MQHEHGWQIVQLANGKRKELAGAVAEGPGFDSHDVPGDEPDEWELLEPDDDELHAAPFMEPLYEDDEEPEDDIWPLPSRDLGDEWDCLTPGRSVSRRVSDVWRTRGEVWR